MRVHDFSKNNIKQLSVDVPFNRSYTIAGNSGSGKSSFCAGIAAEAFRRFVTLLPKSEYQFLFDSVTGYHGTLGLKELPYVQYIGNITLSANPRSTVGTFSGIWRTVRRVFAEHANKPSDFFSFNSPLGWCNTCKGRGFFKGKICTNCSGKRYSEDVLKEKIAIHSEVFSIADIHELSFEKLRIIAPQISKSSSFLSTINNFVDLNVGYLSQSRALSTLSGGELTRVHLASILSAAESSLIILDELSLGLDHESIKKVLSKLTGLGNSNQLWFIDHNEYVRRHAQGVIYFGPGAGKQGGRVVDSIPLIAPDYPQQSEVPLDNITFKSLRCRTIQIPKLELPVKALTVFTGESGCGKSTLLRDCIYPKLKDKARVVLIGQSKYQGVTSRSTLFTYLGLSSFFKYPKNGSQCKKCQGLGLAPDGSECLYCQGKGVEKVCNNRKCSISIYDLLESPIDEIVTYLPEGIEKRRVELLIRLGVGHLSLWRPIRTLSTGEFQCVHLVQESLGEVDTLAFFIFDEPSRGMSQNLLNNLGQYMKELVKKGHTAWVIEHSAYLISIADFVIDFGLRQDVVHALSVAKPTMGEGTIDIQQPCCSSLSFERGMIYGDDESFKKAKSEYYALIKELSPTAQWIYADNHSDKRRPVVAIDFENDNLFSTGTFLYDVNALANQISRCAEPESVSLSNFDYVNKANLCPCCKGKRTIEGINYEELIHNPDGVFLEKNLLHPFLHEALVKFNYSMIKTMFKSLNKKFGINFDKPYSEFSEEEKSIFWNGEWKYQIVFSKNKAKQPWRGVLFLVKKYIRYAGSDKKKFVADRTVWKRCLVCNGTGLFEQRDLSIEGKAFGEWLKLPVNTVLESFPGINLLTDLDLASINIKLDEDISQLGRERQIIIKLLEIKDKSFCGYRFVFRNIRPYLNATKDILDSLAKQNCVELCDSIENILPREELLKKIAKLRRGGITKYGYELFGYKSINPTLAKLKKVHPCPYCKGKGKITVPSPDSGIDDLLVTCNCCDGKGFSSATLSQESVQGEKVQVWLTNDSSQLTSCAENAQLAVESLPLLKRVKDFPKSALYSLLKNWEN